MLTKILLSLFLIGLSGCGTMQLSPLVTEVRDVKKVDDKSKTIQVINGMVWYDGMPPTRGLRLPEGIYVIEAEDADYYYMRSNRKLEMRILTNGKITDGRDLSGGIMMGKSSLRVIPAAGYIDGENGKKIMIWKLGREFLSKEGKEWKRNY